MLGKRFIVLEIGGRDFPQVQVQHQVFWVKGGKEVSFINYDMQ